MMGGRPEGNSGGYGWENHQQPAGEEFEPFRPGDQLAAGEVDYHQVAGERSSTLEGTGRAADVANDGLDVDQADAGSSSTSTSTTRQGRWWTEDVRRPLRSSERVQATRATGGTFVSHVPKGTVGRVTSTRSGVLGGEYATVEFDNGYTEEVPVADLERGREWWQ